MGASRTIERHSDPYHRSHRSCGHAVVCRWASLGHDQAAMVRDVQAASKRLPSGIALRIAQDEDDLVHISSVHGAGAVTLYHANAIQAGTPTIAGREPKSFRDFLLQSTSWNKHP